MCITVISEMEAKKSQEMGDELVSNFCTVIRNCRQCVVQPRNNSNVISRSQIVPSTVHQSVQTSGDVRYIVSQLLPNFLALL